MANIDYTKAETVQAWEVMVGDYVDFRTGGSGFGLVEKARLIETDRHSVDLIELHTPKPMYGTYTTEYTWSYPVRVIKAKYVSV